MSSEAALVEDFAEQLNIFDPSAKLSYIESPQTAAGFPDICLSIQGQYKLIEFKYCDYLPKVRPSQVRWFRENTLSKGPAWMFVQFSKHGFVLVQGQHVVGLTEQKTRERWFDLAENYSFDLSLTPSQWRDFILTLLTPPRGL